MLYDFMAQYLNDEFEEIAVLKQSDRGSVTKLRHRESHRLYICKRFSGSVEPYRQLIPVYCRSLPRIFDAAEKDGNALVLEEFIPGDTLFSLLEAGPLQETDVANICRQLGAALYTLHGLGLVHRDIKPENILLQGEDVWLIDFNAARFYTAEKGNDTQVLGTIGYASPEQYGFSQTDGRTDIYSLGVLINQMLTQEHPSVVLAPGRWGKIVRRCTMTNPAQKYQSIQDFLDALPTPR